MHIYSKVESSSCCGAHSLLNTSRLQVQSKSSIVALCHICVLCHTLCLSLELLLQAGRSSVSKIPARQGFHTILLVQFPLIPINQWHASIIQGCTVAQEHFLPFYHRLQLLRTFCQGSFCMPAIKSHFWENIMYIEGRRKDELMYLSIDFIFFPAYSL